MKCNRCETNNPPGSKFCGSCGTKIADYSPEYQTNTPAQSMPGMSQSAGAPPIPRPAPVSGQSHDQRITAPLPPPGVQPPSPPGPGAQAKFQTPPPPPGAGVQNGIAAPPPPNVGSPPPAQTQYGRPSGLGFPPASPSWLYEKTAQLGMQRNIAGLLCYAFGWLSGLILLFVEKDPYVRFHAAQSVATFGGIHVLTIVLKMMPMFGALWSLLSGLLSLLSLGSMLIWLVLMYKAYNGEYYKAPIVGEMAEQYVQNHPN